MAVPLWFSIWISCTTNLIGKNGQKCPGRWPSSALSFAVAIRGAYSWDPTWNTPYPLGFMPGWVFLGSSWKKRRISFAPVWLYWNLHVLLDEGLRGLSVVLSFGFGQQISKDTPPLMSTELGHRPHKDVGEGSSFIIKWFLRLHEESSQFAASIGPCLLMS